MWRFLQSRAIGRPQFLAAGLLFVYLLECMWLIRAQAVHNEGEDSNHLLRITYGLQQWRGGPVAGTPESLRAETATGEPSEGRSEHLRVRDGFDQDRSPLYCLTAAAPMLLRPGSWTPSAPLWHLLAAAPYLFFGVMLGGSLWYVARRLYGNAGGYIALALYCFSPAMIVNVGGRQSLGEMGAVWGAFGAIWTAIAVAHTLYAPREVVLWNWRRILLLGLSLALTVGNQFSLSVLIVVALLLMLWVAPVRKRAALAIWGAACAVAILLLLSSYFFRIRLFWPAMTRAHWLDFEPASLVTLVSYRRGLAEIVRGSPPLMLALPAALAVFIVWKRARYFGNAVPLAIFVLVLALGMAAPNFPGDGFFLVALTFLFVFVAGAFADLLETGHGLLATAAISGLLIASAMWNVLELARAR